MADSATTTTDDGGYEFINSHFDLGYYFDRPSEQRAARERLAAVCAEVVSLRGKLEAATERGRGESYVVINGWLCEVANQHTCGVGRNDAVHEPNCGMEPIAKVEDLLLGVQR